MTRCASAIGCQAKSSACQPPDDRLDRQPLALGLQNVADGGNHRTGDAQGCACACLLERHERLQIDAVAQRADLRAVRSEIDQTPSQRLGDRDHRRRGFGGRKDHAARLVEIGKDVHVGAARGDHEGQAEPPGKDPRRHAIGIEIMRIDDVRREARGDQRADRRFGPARHEVRGERHAEFGDGGIARVGHRHTVARLGGRHAGIPAIGAEPGRAEREPRHRGDDVGLDRRIGQQMAQPVLDENAVAGIDRVGEQARERQDADRTRGGRR